MTGRIRTLKKNELDAVLADDVTAAASLPDEDEDEEDPVVSADEAIADEEEEEDGEDAEKAEADKLMPLLDPAAVEEDLLDDIEDEEDDVVNKEDGNDGPTAVHLYLPSSELLSTSLMLKVPFG